MSCRHSHVTSNLNARGICMRSYVYRLRSKTIHVIKNWAVPAQRTQQNTAIVMLKNIVISTYI